MDQWIPLKQTKSTHLEADQQTVNPNLEIGQEKQKLPSAQKNRVFQHYINTFLVTDNNSLLMKSKDKLNPINSFECSILITGKQHGNINNMSDSKQQYIETSIIDKTDIQSQIPSPINFNYNSINQSLQKDKLTQTLQDYRKRKLERKETVKQIFEHDFDPKSGQFSSNTSPAHSSLDSQRMPNTPKLPKSMFTCVGYLTRQLSPEFTERMRLINKHDLVKISENDEDDEISKIFKANRLNQSTFGFLSQQNIIQKSGNAHQMFEIISDKINVIQLRNLQFAYFYFNLQGVRCPLRISIHPEKGAPFKMFISTSMSYPTQFGCDFEITTQQHIMKETGEEKFFQSPRLFMSLVLERQDTISIVIKSVYQRKGKHQVYNEVNQHEKDPKDMKQMFSLTDNQREKQENIKEILKMLSKHKKIENQQ